MAGEPLCTLPLPISGYHFKISLPASLVNGRNRGLISLICLHSWSTTETPGFHHASYFTGQKIAQHLDYSMLFWCELALFQPCSGSVLSTGVCRESFRSCFLEVSFLLKTLRTDIFLSIVLN